MDSPRISFFFVYVPGLTFLTSVPDCAGKRKIRVGTRGISITHGALLYIDIALNKYARELILKNSC